MQDKLTDDCCNIRDDAQSCCDDCAQDPSQNRTHPVHVWQASLEMTAKQRQLFTQFLSRDEQQRADRFRLKRDRHHFIASRGLLRWILSQYVAIAPDQIQFDYEAKGKPVLANQGNPDDWQFNLSHSQGLALYAISQGRRVGIDLERFRTIAADPLADRFFTPQEAQTLKSLPPDQKQRAFFRYWTCKEAYLKACGDGLVGLKQITITLTDPVQAVWEGGHRNDHWHLQELHLHPDYAAALAIAGAAPELRYRCHTSHSAEPTIHFTTTA